MANRESSLEEKLERISNKDAEAVLLHDYDRAQLQLTTENEFLDENFHSIAKSKKSWNSYSDLNPRWTVARATRSLLPFSKRLLLFLLPSFIYPWRLPASPNPPHSTAYLDGLRGIAALIVVASHYVAQFAPALYEGYGSGAEVNAKENIYILQLPILRILSSGQFMVVLFFIMSGCVLSIRGLSLARSGKHAEFVKTLASSVFRRWVRLHFPVIAAMFISMIISRANGWTRLPRGWLNPPPQTQIAERSTIQKAITTFTMAVHEPNLVVRENVKKPVRLDWYFNMAPRMKTLPEQLQHWIISVNDVCNPFRFGVIVGNPGPYNAGGILWTIPGEWLGSMVVFLVLFGVAWTTPNIRFLSILIITVYCHIMSKWEIASFLSGMLIAELMLTRDAKQKRKTTTSCVPRMSQMDEEAQIPHHRKQTLDLLWIIFFVTGIYLGSVPYISPASSFGYQTLWHSIPTWYEPKNKFYPCLGSLFILVSLTYYRPLQLIFSTSFMRYLGRISFSLYLLHGQILTSIGIPIMTTCMKFVGGGHTCSGYLMGLFLGLLILTPITVCVSDLFCRAVDEQSVELAKRLAEKVLVF